MSLPDHAYLDYVESSLPPGLPLPKYREIRLQHAPLVKAHGRLLLMVAAAYAGFSGWRSEDVSPDRA